MKTYKERKEGKNNPEIGGSEVCTAWVKEFLT